MVYWPLLAAMTHWPRLNLPERPAHPLDEVLQLDKIAHVLGFGLLMVLVLLSGIGRRLTWSKRCTLALSICLAYALLDELSQAWIPERTVSRADIVANFIAVIGVYLVARQPKRNEHAWSSRFLLWPAILTTPFIIYGLLSPSLMQKLIRLKRTYIDPADLPDIGRLDYWSHGVGAFFISIIVFIIWPTASRRPKLATAFALLILVLSGPAVEVMQSFTGRGVQAMDVLGHSYGVLAAMICWTIWPFRRKQLATPSDIPPAQSVSTGSPAFVGHAVLVSALTLLSRFAGLLRDAILAAALGLSVVADAFFIGFLVPNLFRRLFGEGALTAAFIPNYTDLLERDPALAKRFATLTLTLLSVLLVSITLIVELVLWWIATDLVDNQKTTLAIQYTRLMLPYMPLICAVALIGGVLQVHKRFGPPAAAPLILNGVIIGAVLLATSVFKHDTGPAIVATWVGIGVVIAGILQLYWQAAVLLKVTGLSRSFKGTWPAMRSMLLMMGPMVIGLAVFQINALLDALIAFFFAPAVDEAGKALDQPLTMFGQSFQAPLRNGDVAALNWSQRLYQFPLGVFGIAIATAIFPALSAAASKFMGNDREELAPDELPGTPPEAALDEFASIVRQGLRLTIFIALPATAGLILVRVPLARTVFEHGSFTSNDAMRVSLILAGYASSVWAYSMTHTLTRAFYALKDAKTPLKVSAAMVLLNLTLNLSLIWSLGAAGLAWSTAISAALQVVLLVLLLGKRVKQPIDDSVIASWTRSMIATTVMAGVLFAIDVIASPYAESWSASAGLLGVMVVLGIGVYFAIAKLTKAEELNWLRRRKM
jgi:putative peptidoglycan lipid II flippase